MIACLYWIAYGPLLRRQGYRYREFEARCIDFFNQMVRPPRVDVRTTLERRELRARW